MKLTKVKLREVANYYNKVQGRKDVIKRYRSICERVLSASGHGLLKLECRINIEEIDKMLAFRLFKYKHPDLDYSSGNLCYSGYYKYTISW